MSINQEELSFSQRVPPGGHIRIWKDRPYTAQITNLIRHWPNGCNGLVGVTVGIGQQQIWPESGVLALNDATIFQEYGGIPIPPGNQIWVDVQNADAGNPHTPVVAIYIEEVE